MEISPLDLIQTRVPFLRPLAEFDRDDVRRDFAAELGRDPAFRIDVFTRNLPRSVEVVPGRCQEFRVEPLCGPNQPGAA